MKAIIGFLLLPFLIWIPKYRAAFAAGLKAGMAEEMARVNRVGWFFVVLLIFSCAILGSIADTVWRLAEMLPNGANW